MSNSLKRHRTAEVVEKVTLDEELLCMICTELVVNARQANCCGSIYCKACIEKWLSTKVNGSCPSCRTSLEREDLVVDTRSERQAAAHPRNCQHYHHGCSFVGGRRDVTIHERTCLSNPSACNNVHCLALRASDLARRQQMSRQERDRKKQLLASLWLNREQNLMNLYGLTCVRVFNRNSFDGSCYTLHFFVGAVPFHCRIEVKHYNVSIICWTDDEADLRGPPRMLKFVLIHPSDPALNREVGLYAVTYALSREGMHRGIANWMTAAEFETFTINRKFAFGC